MKRNDLNSIPEKSFDEWMEKVRMSYYHMLKEYLQICKKYDELKTSVRNEKTGKYYNPDSISYYDENGKINWKIVRRFLPKDMEKRIQNEYSLLNDNEVCLICLLFIKVSNEKVVNYLRYKPTSIKSIIYRIRRKTGVKNIQEIFKIITVYFL